jgi:hypothetical protein
MQFSNCAVSARTIWLVGTKKVSHKYQLAEIVNHSMVDDKKNNQKLRISAILIGLIHTPHNKGVIQKTAQPVDSLIILTLTKESKKLKQRKRIGKIGCF